MQYKEYLYHLTYVAFYNIETQEKNLIHKVETIATCITFFRHRRRRRRRRHCLCANSSEQYSIALDSIISIRGCGRGSGSQQQQQYSSLASVRPRAAAAMYCDLQLLSAASSVGWERSEVFASTAYLLTWSWLLNRLSRDVRTYIRSRQELFKRFHCTTLFSGIWRLLFLVGLDPPAASFSVLLCSLLSLFLFSLLALAAHNAKACMRTKHSLKNGPIFFFLSFSRFSSTSTYQKSRLQNLWPFVCSFVSLLYTTNLVYVQLCSRGESKAILKTGERLREFTCNHIKMLQQMPIYVQQLCSISIALYCALARYIVAHLVIYQLLLVPLCTSTAVPLLHSALAMPGVMEYYTGLCSWLHGCFEANQAKHC